MHCRHRSTETYENVARVDATAKFNQLDLRAASEEAFVEQHHRGTHIIVEHTSTRPEGPPEAQPTGVNPGTGKPHRIQP